MSHSTQDSAFFSWCGILGTAAFPETQASVLLEAASGEWGRFLNEYLRPCWCQIIASCRARRLPLTDADDLFQELVLRLIKEGSFRDRVVIPAAVR